jgi:hypothetical protein
MENGKQLILYHPEGIVLLELECAVYEIIKSHILKDDTFVKSSYENGVHTFEFLSSTYIDPYVDSLEIWGLTSVA